MPLVHDVDGGEESKKDIEFKSIKSRAMLSEHMTHSATGRSYARSSVMFKRVQEITDKQKVAKLEEMLNQYYADSM